MNPLNFQPPPPFPRPWSFLALSGLSVGGICCLSPTSTVLSPHLFCSWNIRGVVLGFPLRPSLQLLLGFWCQGHLCLSCVLGWMLGRSCCIFLCMKITVCPGSHSHWSLGELATLGSKHHLIRDKDSCPARPAPWVISDALANICSLLTPCSCPRNPC